MKQSATNALAHIWPVFGASQHTECPMVSWNTAFKIFKYQDLSESIISYTVELWASSFFKNIQNLIYIPEIKSKTYKSFLFL